MDANYQQYFGKDVFLILEGREFEFNSGGVSSIEAKVKIASRERQNLESDLIEIQMVYELKISDPPEKYTKAGLKHINTNKIIGIFQA